MPTARFKEKKVNLLPQKEFEKSTAGRILKWTLSSFRFIVIFMEMLVMAAFLSRFWLDAQNSELNGQINQKKAVITSYATIEKDFRSVQEKVNLIAQLTGTTSNVSYVKTVISYLPIDVRLVSLSKAKDALQISGTSGNEKSIAQLLANLQSVKTFKEVTLSDIGTDKENEALTVFTIKINL